MNERVERPKRVIRKPAVALRKSGATTPIAAASKSRKVQKAGAVVAPAATVTQTLSESCAVETPLEARERKPRRKEKLIRDSFKFPESEYQQFDVLKARLHAADQVAKKSELVRAGLKALAALSDEELFRCFSKVEKLKTGRPAS